MSTSYGPSIAKGNLVFFLDFANFKCYSGSGSLATDLKSNISEQIVSATFSSSNFGVFDLDGVNSYLLNLSSLSSQFSTTSVSMFAWIYPTGAGQVVSELGQAQINTGWHDAQVQITSSGNFCFGVWPHTGFITSSLTYSFSNWYHVGFTYGGTAESGSGTLTAYVNGVSIASNTVPRNAPYFNSYGLYYGLANSDGTVMTGSASYMPGKYGMFMLYNRAITAEEVYQNHLAIKNRYKI